MSDGSGTNYGPNETIEFTAGQYSGTNNGLSLFAMWVPSAGFYCYGDGSSSGVSSGNTSEDNCPKGWHMPTGGLDGEYAALYFAYSSDSTNFRNDLSTTLSGSMGGQVNKGSYNWSTTRNSDVAMYRLRVTASGTVDMTSYESRTERFTM